MKKLLSSSKSRHKRRDYNQTLLYLSRYQQVLLDFVNAEDSKQARKVITGSLQEWFKFKTPRLSVITVYQKRLRELFGELNNATNLLDSDKIHDFTFDYIPIRSEAVIEVQEDGTLGESTIHLMNRPFGDIITHCVIKMFSDERNVKLLYRCESEKCRQYFMGVTAKPKHGPNRRKYCPKGCKAFCKEKRRIARGYHRDYKREKRKDPKAPLSYYGYKEKKQ